MTIKEQNLNRLLYVNNEHLNRLRNLYDYSPEYIYTPLKFKSIPEPYNPIKNDDMCLTDYLESLKTKKSKKK